MPTDRDELERAVGRLSRPQSKSNDSTGEKS